MTRRLAWIGVVGLWVACENASAPTETPERPLYYLKAPANNGDRQSDTVLATLALPFRVLVRRGETPASGIAVTWEIDGDTLTGVPSFSITSLTDNTGIATSPFRLTLGSTAGPYAVRARVQGVFVPSPIQVFTDVPCGSALCFTATALPGRPRHLRYISGDGQIATVGTTLDADYVVQSTDAYGNGSPGVAIHWAVTAGGGTIAPTQSTTTAPRGFASARHTLGSFDEIQSVRATALALPDAPQVTFTATGFSALPVASVSVTPESVSVQSDRTTQLSVVLRDADGRLVIRRPVTWTSLDPAVAFVDTSGLVRGSSPGTTHVVAESEGVRDSAAITVTEGPPPVIFASIVAGLYHTCGLRSDGAAYCWGGNEFGQLGDSSRTSRTTPVAVVGGHVFNTLVAGSEHICGLTSTGAAYCWGRGGFGQLGNGYLNHSAIPVAVSGGTFASLGSGPYHSCGVTSAGKAYCWGWNGYGQLGDGRFSNAAIPVAVAGSLTFATIGNGRGPFLFPGGHTCGVTDSGAGYCWGSNEEGQLGDTAVQYSAVPLAVIGGLKFVAMSTGWLHTCGLTDAAVVQCWGDNHFGQLGDNPQVCDPGECSRPGPRPVFGSANITDLTSGHGHNCQLTNSGAASCWGLNDAGQVGDGTTERRYVPAAVFGGITFSELAGGGSHTCGLSTTGVTYCWGSNGSGQLGDGTTTSRSLPVRVVSEP